MKFWFYKCVLSVMLIAGICTIGLTQSSAASSGQSKEKEKEKVQIVVVDKKDRDKEKSGSSGETRKPRTDTRN